VIALWSSFAVVALAEMGDKTQLLALALASRYRRPWPVMTGILIATLANHALAASVGVQAVQLIPPAWLAWIVGLGFIAFGCWILVPDRADARPTASRFGPLATTAVLFFLAEIGDKTQLATVALGAHFHSTIAVTAGTTAGMLLADGLAVAAGDRLTAMAPMRVVRWIAAALFFAFGVAAIAAIAAAASVTGSCDFDDGEPSAWSARCGPPRAPVGAGGPLASSCRTSTSGPYLQPSYPV
jgi:putative Ca2+/H+ antiporter (TMEM165/GDT1 family)